MIDPATDRVLITGAAGAIGLGVARASAPTYRRTCC